MSDRDSTKGNQDPAPGCGQAENIGCCPRPIQVLATAKRRALSAAALAASAAVATSFSVSPPALGATGRVVPPAARCKLAPASLVNKVLGTSLKGPQVVTKGQVTVCAYGQSTHPNQAIVRFQGATSGRAFSADRRTFEKHEEPTVTLPGLADSAFYATAGLPPQQVYVVVVLKNGIELVVTGPGSLTKVEALARRILPAV